MTSRWDLDLINSVEKRNFLATVTPWDDLIEDIKLLDLNGFITDQDPYNTARDIFRLKASGTRHYWLVLSNKKEITDNQFKLIKRLIHKTQLIIDSKSSNTKSQLDQMLMEVVTKVDARSSAIYLLKETTDGEGPKKVWQAVSKFNLPEGPSLNLDIDEGICGYLFKNQKHFYITNNYNKDPNCSKSLTKYHFVSVASVALKSDGKMIGALVVESNRVGTFKESYTIPILQSFSHKIGDHLHKGANTLSLHSKWVHPDNLVGNAPFAVIAAHKGKVTFVNKRATEIFGYLPHELYGKSVLEIHASKEAGLAIGKRLFSNGTVEAPTAMARHKNNTIFPVRLHAVQTGPQTSVGFVESKKDLDAKFGNVSLLATCSNILKSPEDDRVVIQRLLTNLLRTLPASYCAIYYTNRKGEYKRAYLMTNKDKFSLKKVIKIKELKVSWLKNGWVTDRTKKDDLFFEFLNIFNIKKNHGAAAFFPIKKNGEGIGFLCFGSLKPEKYSAFYRHDRNAIFRGIADQLAGFLYKVQILKSRERSLAHLEAFFKAGDALISSKSLEHTMGKVAQHILDVSHAWWVSVLLIDRDGRVSDRMKAGNRNWPRTFANVRPSGLTQHVLINKETLVIDDVEDSTHKVNREVKAFGVKAVWCLPLLLRNQAIGVIWLHFKRTSPYPKSDLHHLQHFADQAALAVDSVQSAKQQAKTLEVLEKLDKATNTEETHQIIVDAVSDILGTSSAMFCIYNRHLGRMHPKPYFANHSNRTEHDDWKAWAVEELTAIKHTNLQSPKMLGARGLVQALAFDRDETIRGVLLFKIFHGTKLWEREIVALKTLAKHAAFAMKRADLMNRLEDALELARVTAKAGARGGLSVTLNTTAVEIQRRLRADFVVISTYDELRDRVRDFIFKASPRRSEKKGLFLKKDPDLQMKLLSGNARWIEHRSKCVSKEIRSMMTTQDIQSFASLPLVVNRKRVGWLGLFYNDPHIFDPEERNNIKLVANLVAATVKNALLHDINAQQANRLVTMKQLGRETITSLDRNQLLELLEHRGQELVDNDTGKSEVTILLLERPIEKSEAPSSSFKLWLSNGQETFMNDNPLIEQCVREGETAQDKTGKSEIAVPIIAGNQVIGIFHATHSESKAFDDGLLMALEVIATQASIALQSARFYDNLKRMGGMVGKKTALEWLSMVGATWGHNIHREAAIARQKISLLRRRLRGKVDDAQIERLMSLDQHFEKIRDMPLLAPLTGEETITEFELAPWLSNHVLRWEKEDFQEIVFNFVWPANSLFIRASKNWLYRLFEIIVENGKRVMLKHGTEQPRFSISIAGKDQHAVITIANNGPRIPQKVAVKMFENIIKREEGGHGAGIGLVLARTIAETYGGDLYANTDLLEGAEFVLTLPLVLGK